MRNQEIKRLAVKSRDSLRSDIIKRYLNNKSAVFGAVILIVILVCCVFADFIVPRELVTKYNVSEKLLPPSTLHLFGTDNLGRDIFARVLHGARISVGIGVGATLASLMIGAAIASICAVFKKTDFIIMRIIDIITCVPAILLALVLLAVLGGNIFNMILTLAIVSVPGFAIRIRSVLLSVVEQDYVQAARLSGTSTLKLILKHILPNAIDPIIVDATMTTSSMMLSAAGLSFIGVGIAPPAPEWGAMLNYAQQYFQTKPYMAIIPGAAITITALSINLVGDGLRDALDPKTGR